MSIKLTSGDPALAGLVERQMRNWELARLQRPVEPTPHRPAVQDFLCISRMVGVQCEEIARRLGGQLDRPVFGREIIEAMAGDDDIRRRIYASMDQRHLAWWEESLRSLMQRQFVRNDYFRKLCETLLSLAHHAPSVFVGRGADLVLPQQRGFRVRLIASLEARTNQYAATHSLRPGEARREIERIEGERADFFRHHFGVEAIDPLRHDLTINLDRWPSGQVVELILQARSLHRTAAGSSQSL